MPFTESSFYVKLYSSKVQGSQGGLLVPGFCNWANISSPLFWIWLPDMAINLGAASLPILFSSSSLLWPIQLSVTLRLYPMHWSLASRDFTEVYFFPTTPAQVLSYP